MGRVWPNLVPNWNSYPISSFVLYYFLNHSSGLGVCILQSDDHTNYVADPNALAKTELGQKMQTEGNLAMPITNIRDVKKKITKS